MNDENRGRLQRMVARYERQRAALGVGDAERDAEKAAAFFAELTRVFTAVLRPIIAEIGEELRRAGHDYRVEEQAADGSPRLDLFLLVRGRSGSMDRIQFLVREEPGRGRELIVELVLKRSPVELVRFQWPSELTREVGEHVLVSGIEQLFASPAM